MKIMEERLRYLDAPVIRITGKDVPIALCRQSRKARPPECGRSDRGGKKP